jgi:hypothetical protein
LKLKIPIFSNILFGLGNANHKSGKPSSGIAGAFKTLLAKIVIGEIRKIGIR